MLVAFSATAQTATAPATRRPDPIQGELQRRFEAEAIEKVLSRRPQPATAHERRALLDQIRKDFLRIQVIDDELKKERASADEPDVKAVSRYVAEIRRRGERLKDNLSLPKVDTASSSSPSPETREYLRLRLDDLSKSINAFVANPIFESAKIVNPNLSIQASNDLERIISVSKEIKRTSDRLQRAASRPKNF
jgi:hypothetical protein